MRNSVLVVGSGMMGSGIGAMAALAGNPTMLLDVDRERAEAGVARAKECIRLRRDEGLNSPEEASRAEALLSAQDDLAQSVSRARLIVEAIVEKLEAKQALFEQLDRLAPPEVPLCSNTSGLQITEISARCAHPERTMTTHFWLPAHLVPLVEVVMGDRTEEARARQVVQELKGWQKTPVLVRRDLPGQLANRIFQAMIRESVAIVASGLASAEDVDAAIGCGMAMRLPVWGPLEHLDAIGLELGLSVQDGVLPSISAEQRANPYLRELVARGETGAAAGQGFYDWSKRDVEAEKRRRDSFIIGAVKLKKRLDEEENGGAQ